MSQKLQRREFTEEEKEVYQQSFQGIDEDGDGYLTRDEFSIFLRDNSFDTSFVDAIFKVFDEDKNNKLTFDEFLRYIDACNESCTNPTYLFKLIFDAIDEDHSNDLSVDEMLEFAKLVGMPMTREQILEEMDVFDSDGSGTVNFQELCSVLGLL